MNFGNIVGQTLDGKYRIERELGKGGMGAVFLSTHLGTERPVAVKVIVPEFMERPEFIERFRREAKAAGRLRHPNVVDVTDFGIAETQFGKVAYLVMEYLDGCTLGEVLDEEKSLPVSWTIDILEQVCSAVQEAHHQGIIHRDLKPDNIWLEPNQRGGYTVKVLDFGIAKLETHDSADKVSLPEDVDEIVRRIASETVADQNGAIKKTLIGNVSGNTAFAGNKDLTAISDLETIGDDGKNTAMFEPKTLIQTDESGTPLFSNEAKNENGEAGTLIQNPETADENKTAILTATDDAADEFSGTKLFSSAGIDELETDKNSQSDETNQQKKTTQELTRVGAVLGTPLYMSPEQCRGEHLTAQSDIYSLAIIAYQMLDGKTPFEGAFTDVMEAHKTSDPPLLKAKNVPRRLKKIIARAMAKNPSERPVDAEAFAAVLRAQSEGLRSLYRHAIAIYSANLPKFLLLSFLVFLPVTLLSITPMVFKLFQYFGMVESTFLTVVGGISTVLSTLAGFFCGAVGFGTATLLVTRHLSAPLRPLDLRSAFRTVKSKWKTIFGLSAVTTLLILLTFIVSFVPLIFIGGIVFFAQKISPVLAGILGAVLGIAALVFGLWLIVNITSRFGFVTPAIVMENLRGRAALRRSNDLFKRSPWKIMMLYSANFILPIFVSGLIMLFIAAVIGNIPSDNQFLRGMGARKTNETIIKENEEKKAQGIETKPDGDDMKIDFGSGSSAPNVTYNTTDEKDVSSNEWKKEWDGLSQNDRYARGAGDSLRNLLFQLTWFPVAVFITSFIQVLMSLMYVKTRQAGGEPMRDLLKQFEDDDKPQTRWQERIHKRLIQSGRITGRTQ